jgi:hypothetical protein
MYISMHHDAMLATDWFLLVRTAVIQPHPINQMRRYRQNPPLTSHNRLIRVSEPGIWFIL